MSLRHNLLMLLAGACALALIGPWLPPQHGRGLGSIVTAAPPLVIDDRDAWPSADRNLALSPVRQEATGALDRLRNGN